MVTALVRRWNDFWFAPGSPITLGMCRALFFGTLLLWQWSHDFKPWGAYSSVFWMPIWLFDTFGVPAFPPNVIGWIQLIWKASLLLSTIGLFTRVSMIVATATGVYLMGLPHNFGQTQHFDTLVVFASGALALSRAGDAASVDAWLARRSRRPHLAEDAGEYTWPIRFVWVAMALIFCAAGISKWRRSGFEWIFSDNLALLLQRQQYHLSDGEPLTNWGPWIAQHGFARPLAAFAMAVETLFPLALFSRAVRLVMVPAGLMFLIGIRVLMGPTFEQFMLCYVFWVPWEGVLYNARAYAAHFALRRAPLADAPELAASDRDLAAGH